MDAVVTPIGIAQIVWRNSAPIVGILFFHWSTTNVLVLYFLDTMLSFGVILAGLLTPQRMPLYTYFSSKI